MIAAALLALAATSAPQSAAPSIAPVAIGATRPDDALRATRLAHLRGQRQRWRAWGYVDYDVTLEETDCFCNFGPYYGPVRVSVRSGRLVRAVYLGATRDGYRAGARLSIDTGLKRTVEQLFDELERVVSGADSQAWVTVEYDRTYGFPTVFGFDRPDFADEQSRVVLTDFVPYVQAPRKR